MPVTININGLTLCHRASEGIAKCTVPDMCFTPGSPLPVPYPNIAVSANLAKGTKTIIVDGGNMAANKGSEFSVSAGDELGTLGGIISGMNMKEATWLSYSFDVKMEGRGAARLTDKMLMNHSNTFCMDGVLQEWKDNCQSPDKCTIDCIIDGIRKFMCNDPELAKVIGEVGNFRFIDKFYERSVPKRFNGNNWEEYHTTWLALYRGFTFNRIEITLDNGRKCTQQLESIRHELRHSEQSAFRRLFKKNAEIDAERTSAEWANKTKLPLEDKQYNIRNGQTINKDELERWYKESYPEERCIGVSKDGKAIIKGIFHPFDDSEIEPYKNMICGGGEQKPGKFLKDIPGNEICTGGGDGNE